MFAINAGVEVSIPEKEFYEIKSNLEKKLEIELSNEEAAEIMSVIFLKSAGLEDEIDEDGFALHGSFIGLTKIEES